MASVPPSVSVLSSPSSATSAESPPAVNWVGSTAPPSGGILRNSISR